jgi:hypothetical protein
MVKNINDRNDRYDRFNLSFILPLEYKKKKEK